MIQIVLPECSEDKISADLRYLTQVLEGQGEDISGGLLGGKFGYGAYFENDTFMMHPYCWCEQDNCPWCMGCTCPRRVPLQLLPRSPEPAAHTMS